MNNSIVRAFGFDNSNVRTAQNDDGTIWFCLGDLLNAMGTRTDINQVKMSIQEGLGEDTLIKLPLQTAGGEQDMLFVSEAGMTFLLSRSRTESGKKLNRFLHAEVLPSIRKTGSYSIASEPISPLQRQLAPQRDLCDYHDMAVSLGIDKDPILVSLFSQRLAEQLGGKVIAATQQVILTVRAHELGYSAKDIGTGSALGTFVKKQGCTPNGKTQHGRYSVNVFDLTAELDTAIHAYFS